LTGSASLTCQIGRIDLLAARIEGITSSSGNDEDQDVIIIHGVLSSPPSTLP
jgi:hypothetical protein